MTPDRDLIACPACLGRFDADLACERCGFRAEVVEGVLDLRVDKAFDTFLDTDAYDAEHGVSRAPDPKLSHAYSSLLERNGVRAGGRVLEIAAGSGLLTASMLADGRFDAIHCSDISPAFMAQLSRRVGDGPESVRVHKYLFDANRLPFRDGSFDAVFGNSVLHHFARFEDTIRDCFRVLRPEGAAVFAEPVLDTHALVSLAAGIILGAEERSGGALLSVRHVRTLEFLKGRAAVKAANLRADRESLKTVEDKFVFPTLHLIELGTRIGFSRVVFEPPPEGFALGVEVRGAIERVFRQMTLDAAVLDAFDFVFESLTVAYGEPMSPHILPVFTRVAMFK